MLFKELKQNSTVYLLKRDGFTYLEGRVKESGIPHYDQRAIGGMVVDITIETEGEYYTYVFDENKEVYNGKGMIISTTKEGLVKEIERMKNGAMELLASVKEQEEILRKSEELLCRLNPDLKERKNQELRLTKIEEGMNELRELLKKSMEQKTNFGQIGGVSN